MARDITWTESASDDVAEIASYIARDSESYASTVVRELIAAGRSLTILAERGRVVQEYLDPTIRQLLVRDYRVVYQDSDSTIHVLRIIHGARLLPPRSPNP